MAASDQQMTSPVVSVLVLGFLLGLRHATDADHVVAVTTIVSRERRLWRAALIGFSWGLGHTVTIFVVGGSILVFNVVIPARVGLAMELTVALMLIALGMATLSRRLAVRDRGPIEPTPCATKPAFGTPRGPRLVGDSRSRTAVRPVLVGIVHGLAGSAAVALLVLSTIHGARWALLYLALFGLGTVAGMVLLTTAIALPFTYTSRRFGRANAWLARATGLASIALGTFIAYQLIAGHGLFSPDPHWIPG